MKAFKYLLFITFLTINGLSVNCQKSKANIDSFRINPDIKITIDQPAFLKKNKPTIITFYALPNGNTTEQTMGKKMETGDDWHFDIQHIKAQTRLIRQQLAGKNFVVIYLENDFQSWPAWKQKHPDFGKVIPHLVDSLSRLFTSKKSEVYLNGHSGGGSFIFGYLSDVKQIPDNIKRISFLDSDYGYDSSYYQKFRDWLQIVKGSALNIFAYNDSIALYNGKPFVSATGGTWFKSHLFLKHLQSDFLFSEKNTDSLFIIKSNDKRIQFFFKKNLDRGIYHTQQVELNGFIHSVLCGTRHDSRKYKYYSTRAYYKLIE
ncbi:MAG: hypothetical protein WBC06_05700 [Chitinophagaceae bacterium]